MADESGELSGGLHSLAVAAISREVLTHSTSEITSSHLDSLNIPPPLSTIREPTVDDILEDIPRVQVEEKPEKSVLVDAEANDRIRVETVMATQYYSKQVLGILDKYPVEHDLIDAVGDQDQDGNSCCDPVLFETIIW